MCRTPLLTHCSEWVLITSYLFLNKGIYFCHAVSLQSLWTVNIKEWQSLNTMEQNTVTDAISAKLMQTMNSLCTQCEISSDHFSDSMSEVIDNTVYSLLGIYYTSYIVYSSPEGSMTASTLVALLQHWLLEEEENEMQVTVGDVHLVIYKLCGLDNSNPVSKLLCLTSLSTTLQAPTPSPVVPLNNTQAHTSAVIAGTFVGGMLTGALCSVIAALSWSVEMDYCVYLSAMHGLSIGSETQFFFTCSIFVYKRFSSHRTNNTPTEIEMKDKVAYEEINVGVRQRPQIQRPTRVTEQQQTDHIYDL